MAFVPYCLNPRNDWRNDEIKLAFAADGWIGASNARIPLTARNLLQIED